MGLEWNFYLPSPPSPEPEPDPPEPDPPEPVSPPGNLTFIIAFNKIYFFIIDNI